MSPRPQSITVISWFLIATSIINLLSITFLYFAPMAKELLNESQIPTSAHYKMICFSLIVTIVCGVALLNKQNWGRFLYVCISIIGFLISLGNSKPIISLIPAFILFIIITYFLFRQDSNKHFTLDHSKSEI